MIKILNVVSNPQNVEEIKYSYSFFDKYLSRYFGKENIAHTEPSDKLKAVIRIYPDKKYFIFRYDPETWLPEFSFKIINDTVCKTDADILLPVFNLTENQQQIAKIDFFYHNIRGVEELARHISENYDRQTPSESADSAVFCVSKSYLEDLGDITIRELPDVLSGKKLVLNSWFVHKMGKYYISDRSDLVKLIDPDKINILDVGAGGGSVGKLLRNKNKKVYAVEPNRFLADSIKGHYDNVFCCKIEELDTEDKFDAVIMGDVIEHIYDPVAALKNINALLAKDGVLISSVPNTGHWSIVKDILDGYFEYIPFGLLCVSHIRFFTEKTLIELLDDCGFKIVRLEREKPEPSPAGKAFIKHMTSGNFGKEEELLTAEFRFVARKK